MKRIVFCVIFLVFLSQTAFTAPVELDRYAPIKGGWQIRISGDGKTERPAVSTDIGVIVDNPRMHRRPLYPPSDKSLVWNEDQRAKMVNIGFRPLVVAYNEPRFLFDYHSAGGLLGHLRIGLVMPGTSKWLHDFSEITARYVDGRMEYTLTDTAIKDVKITVEASALADSVGLAVHVKADGLSKGASLVWAYGGASAFFTNYNMLAPEFTFKPAQCTKDRVQWDKEVFSLHRKFDKSDSIMEQCFAAARFIPDWEAVIRGGSSFSKGKRGTAAPEAFIKSPADLVKAAQWTSVIASGAKQSPQPAKSMSTVNGGDCFAPLAMTEGAAHTDAVIVEQVPAARKTLDGYIFVGMGGDMDEILKKPAAEWQSALARNADIASRIVVDTPDPYLNAAATMMAFATDGTWGDSTTVHGGWSWRFGYLGWRTWYGPLCYGWEDRVRTSIQNFVAHGLITKGDDIGAMSSILDQPGGVFYNMNEVFLDHVRAYFDYTNDRELMAQILPVLIGIVNWENRRLQPGNENLYENALNTWISDSHWYIQGQCTQASAYMLRAHQLLADLTKKFGLTDQAIAYERKADDIRKAMQEKLWMPDAGVFAEYLDTRGEKMLHREPELPTLYHSAEFGAADQFQIYSMLHWADTHLGQVQTPYGGKMFWSSNWYPNNGRSYTYSTFEMAYGEELNFALTHYLGGRADDAYSIFCATLCGIFNGPTPGGLSCHAFSDGRQRANDEFADAESMWGRTLAEGLFGIVPKLSDGYVELRPQFPSDWKHASIKTRHLSYDWKLDDGKALVRWDTPDETSVHLRLPLHASKIGSVNLDGQPVEYEMSAGLCQTWVEVNAPNAKHGTFEIIFAPATISAPEAITCAEGAPIELSVPDVAFRGTVAAKEILKDATIVDGKITGIAGAPGNGIVFDIWSAGEQCPVLVPFCLNIEPKNPVLTFPTWTPPVDPSKHDPNQWTMLNISDVFSSTIIEALEKVFAEATPPPAGASTVGFDYWKSHLSPLHHGERVQMPSDAAWRAKVGSDGVAWTADGIPFKTVAQGPNIGIVTQAGGFPKSLEFKAIASGKTLYLMLSDMSFPVQSHMPHLRITLTYSDKSHETTTLTSPATIGDCWSTWCGRWHDTAANGFENLGGRFGPAGSADVKDMTQPIRVDTEAHLVAIPIALGKTIQTVRINAIANDIVFGVMGATILK